MDFGLGDEDAKFLKRANAIRPYSLAVAIFSKPYLLSANTQAMQGNTLTMSANTQTMQGNTLTVLANAQAMQSDTLTVSANAQTKEQNPTTLLSYSNRQVG